MKGVCAVPLLGKIRTTGIAVSSKEIDRQIQDFSGLSGRFYRRLSSSRGGGSVWGRRIQGGQEQVKMGISSRHDFTALAFLTPAVVVC